MCKEKTDHVGLVDAALANSNVNRLLFVGAPHYVRRTITFTDLHCRPHPTKRSNPLLFPCWLLSPSSNSATPTAKQAASGRPRPGMPPPPIPGRQEVSSGGPYEAFVGYSRAVRVGAHISVAGTTATDLSSPPGAAVAVLHPGDAGGQTRVILATIGAALVEAGASLADVVSTRMYVVDPVRDWGAVGAAHAAAFGAVGVRPAATVIGVASLVHRDMRVEIEATAVVPAED